VLRFHLSGIASTLLILVLTLVPGDEMPEWNYYANINPDKIAHFALFSLLAVTNCIGFKKSYFYGRISYNPVKMVVCLSLVLAAFTELLQNRIALRSFEALDIVSNAAGVLFGTLLFRALYGKELFLK
jgi:VanZ family protein